MTTYDETFGNCKSCKKKRLKRKGMNHTLHVILALITCGFWLVVWLGIALLRAEWACAACGSQNVTLKKQPLSTAKFAGLALVFVIAVGWVFEQIFIISH